MSEAKPDQVRSAIPRDAQAATRVAAALDLVIPAACLPGVIDNLALLDRHAAIFTGQIAP